MPFGQFPASRFAPITGAASQTGGLPGLLSTVLGGVRDVALSRRTGGSFDFSTNFTVPGLRQTEGRFDLGDLVGCPSLWNVTQCGNVVQKKMVDAVDNKGRRMYWIAAGQPQTFQRASFKKRRRKCPRCARVACICARP